MPESIGVDAEKHRGGWSKKKRVTGINQSTFRSLPRAEQFEYAREYLNKKDKDLFNHPTIKPLDLVKRHLLHTTQENDIVLDCFMGSGTTAVACQETNRQYIGFEIEPKWVKVANDRLNKVDANGQQCMFLR